MRHVVLRRAGLCSLIAALAALVLTAPAAWAQGVTTGTISGTVTAAEDGEALPGALVEAVHEPTGSHYEAVTRADGTYALRDLRVGGPYTMTCTMTGFETQKKSDVFLEVGEDIQVDFELQLDTIEENEEP